MSPMLWIPVASTPATISADSLHALVTIVLVVFGGSLILLALCVIASLFSRDEDY